MDQSIKSILDDAVSLSRDEIDLLCVRVRRGDLRARELLIRSQYKYAWSSASSVFNKFQHILRSADVEDFFQAAIIAVTNAVDSYDPNRRTLTSWCDINIRKELQHLLYRSTGQIVMPNAIWENKTPRNDLIREALLFGPSLDDPNTSCTTPGTPPVGLTDIYRN